MRENTITWTSGTIRSMYAMKRLYEDAKKDYLKIKGENDPMAKAIREAKLVAYWRVLDEVFGVIIDIEKILY